MSELTAAEGFMSARIHSNPTLAQAIAGDFSETVPRNTQGIVVLWEFQGGEDGPVFNNIRISVTATYIVSVVGINTDEELDPIYDMLDAVLDRSEGFFGGYRIAACVRTSPHKRTETVEEVEWRYLGGFYEFYVQPPGV